MSTRKPPKPGTRRPRSPGKGRGARVVGRPLAERVKTAKGRKSSSTRWLKRQLNDPYVAGAQRLGYRSRAAFKLAELDDRFRFLTKGARVVDLGAAPGGWTQVSVERTGGRVVGLDLLEMAAITGADLLQGDFLEDGAVERLLAALAGPADVVLSDMAAAATGHPATDHLRIMGLLEAATDFAAQVLAPGGSFVGKVLKGGTENDLLARLKRDFRSVRHAKPPASRDDSAESYVVATGFRGTAA
ncbi:MAG: RlmE family RNA methyltransferase [Rhodospirillaceae bacterium]